MNSFDRLEKFVKYIESNWLDRARKLPGISIPDLQESLRQSWISGISSPGNLSKQVKPKSKKVKPVKPQAFFSGLVNPHMEKLLASSQVEVMEVQKEEKKSVEEAEEMIDQKKAAEIVEKKNAAELIEEMIEGMIDKKAAAEKVEKKKAAEIIEQMKAAEIIEQMKAAEIIEQKKAAELVEKKKAAEIIEQKKAAEKNDQMKVGDMNEQKKAAMRQHKQQVPNRKGLRKYDLEKGMITAPKIIAKEASKPKFIPPKKKVCSDPTCIFCNSKSCKMCKMCLMKKKCYLRNCPNILSSPIEFDKLFPNCARLVSSKESDETEVDEAIKCIMVEDIGREYGIESEVNIATSSFVPDHTIGEQEQGLSSSTISPTSILSLMKRNEDASTKHTVTSRTEASESDDLEGDSEM